MSRESSARRIGRAPLRGLAALCLAASVAPALAAAPSAAAAAADEVALWPEAQRAFLQDGPGWLLPDTERARLLAAGAEERDALIRDFLADPLPETAANELTAGIERRRRLVRGEHLGGLDERARLLFLHGPPLVRRVIDCAETFKPLEIWSYDPDGPQLVLYRPASDLPYKLWLPLHGKRELYTSDMGYWLEQWEELEGKLFRAERFDYQLCKEARAVDVATGVWGLTGYRRERATAPQLLALLAPPADLAAWARQAATTPLPEGPPDLAGLGLDLAFPEEHGQRIVARFFVTVPATAGLKVFEEEERRLLKLIVEGLVEHEGRQFETFRVRYELPAPPPGAPVALVLDRALRPERVFLVRLRVRDEVGGGEAFFTRGLRVPAAAEPAAEPPVPEDAIVALGEEVAQRPLPGRDGVILVPPAEEVVLGLWRAEALVSGERIAKVVFLVDGVAQLTRTKAPYSAELRMPALPRETSVRVEGYDAAGALVASDEIVLNQPTGELRVRIVEPRRGWKGPGRTRVRLELVVPEGRRVERVEFLLDDRVVATRDAPPWEAMLDVPAPVGEVSSYLTVVATLDDGSRAEDVHFLNAPQYLEEVEVDLVELYTTVTDRSARLVRDLQVGDFRVVEDGRPQAIVKFELVEDLPLTLGFLLDTSGSMVSSLGEAQRAAVGFLRSIMTPRDQAFAITFSDKPVLVMPRTDDVGAVAEALEDLQAYGWTSLHDAVTHALYYFRGTRGRRALILLSDGEDTASSIPWRDALEYARRSGVAIYTIGLNLRSFGFPDLRDRLRLLSEETGGRAFFVGKAEELALVYDEIERELRSQYLLAYASDSQDRSGAYRTVAVEAKGGKLKARTLRGYYP